MECLFLCLDISRKELNSLHRFRREHLFVSIVSKELVQLNVLVQKMNIVHRIETVGDHRMKPLFL